MDFLNTVKNKIYIQYSSYTVVIIIIFEQSLNLLFLEGRPVRFGEACND